MDTANLQSTVLTVLFALVLVSLGVTLFRDVWKRRKMLKTANAEEDSLGELLDETLDPNDYIVLENQPIMTLLGKSRADYIIVSRFGLFFLEFRSYYKFIRAEENKQKWLRWLGLFGRKEFTSPLWQCKVHIHSIQEIIGEKPGLKYFAMAVFPSFVKIDEAEFEPTSFVGTYEEFLPFIKAQTEEVLTPEEMEAIARLIEAYGDKVDNMEQPENLPTSLPDEYKPFTDTTSMTVGVRQKAHDEDYDDEEYDEDDEDADRDKDNDANAASVQTDTKGNRS